LYWFKNNKLRKNSAKVRKAVLPVILYHPANEYPSLTLSIPVVKNQRPFHGVFARKSSNKISAETFSEPLIFAHFTGRRPVTVIFKNPGT